MKVSDEELQALRKGDERLLRTIYKKFRRIFIWWALRKFPCTKEDAEDIFQDIVIMLYLLVRSELIVHLAKDVECILYTMGRKYLWNFVRAQKVRKRYAESERRKDEPVCCNLAEEKFDSQQKQAYLKQLLSVLTPAEREFVYYTLENKGCKSIKEMAAERGFSSVDVYYSKQSKCIAKIEKYAASR